MLEKLIKINEQKRELEIELNKKKGQFEESIAIEKAQLEDLTEQENLLRQEALLFLESENKTSEKIGDKTIIRQTKKTLKVENPFTLRNNILKIKAEDYGGSQSELVNAFEDVTIIKNKKLVDELVSAYEKVEGRLLEGVISQETNYIIIK